MSKALYKFIDGVHKAMYERTIFNVLIPAPLCARLTSSVCNLTTFCKALVKCNIKPIVLTSQSIKQIGFEEMQWNEVTVPEINDSILVSDNVNLKFSNHLVVLPDNTVFDNKLPETAPVVLNTLEAILFCLLGCKKMELDTYYPFGHISLPSYQIFYKTNLSYCTVNLKPFVPGHVLVIPRRPVPTIDLLTETEAADVMIVTRKVVKMIKELYEVNSVTVTIQDGPPAGQTIPHVHVHVMPRKWGDFENGDDIYTMLDKADIKPCSSGYLPMIPDCDRIPRVEEDMTKEAKIYAEFVSKML